MNTLLERVGDLLYVVMSFVLLPVLTLFYVFLFSWKFARVIHVFNRRVMERIQQEAGSLMPAWKKPAFILRAKRLHFTKH